MSSKKLTDESQKSTDNGTNGLYSRYIGDNTKIMEKMLEVNLVIVSRR